MIEVIIRHAASGAELGRIEIENVGGNEENGDYSVRFGVEKIRSVGVHQRGFMNFPRKQYNVLGLLLQALSTLEPQDLQIDGAYEDRKYNSHKRNWFRRLG